MRLAPASCTTRTIPSAPWLARLVSNPRPGRSPAGRCTPASRRTSTTPRIWRTLSAQGELRQVARNELRNCAFSDKEHRGNFCNNRKNGASLTRKGKQSLSRLRSSAPSASLTFFLTRRFACRSVLDVINKGLVQIPWWIPPSDNLRVVYAFASAVSSYNKLHKEVRERQ